MRTSSIFLSCRWSRLSSRHRLPGVERAARGADAVGAGEELRDAVVPPLAVAVNWSSEMSMTQLPRPIGMPASVAVYLSFEPALRCCDTSRIGGKDGRQ